MPINRTAEFKRVVKEHGPIDTKRRKVAQPEGKDVFDKEYLKEGYVVLNHINTLTRMLSHIRKPYLNIDSRPTRQNSPRTLDLRNGSDESWSTIRHLTNEERDQIDLQARVIFTRCSDRVKEMEALEKRRVEIAASKANPLARFLPARLRQDTTSASDFVAAHHASITWYLSRRLAEASQTQKEMQEERVKRQMERTQTLGSHAAREVAFVGETPPAIVPPESKGNTLTGSWLESASSNLASGWAATMGASPRMDSRSISSSTIPIDETEEDDDDDDDIELTASQIQQFEDENATILRSVQDTLASVQQAESRLMEISVLQSELITHLTQQTELTDQLYEDAIATTSTMEQGNEQLKEAKRRGKDSRLYILVFLIGASLSLLFVHYY